MAQILWFTYLENSPIYFGLLESFQLDKRCKYVEKCQIYWKILEKQVDMRKIAKAKWIMERAREYRKEL